ncbi:MAG: DUF3313 domain-containing protein [Candidatus Competibacteraceae bacterium]|jgi:hypothetical protein|nr:DUF3313 domain-containing protein [Candidatus Competibacteraceae bacterium]
MINRKKWSFRSLRGVVLVVGSALLAGCGTQNAMLGSGTAVTVSDKTRLTESGFLSDYARLQPTSWGQGMECWSDPKLDPQQYDKVLISRIVVSLVPPKDEATENTIDPSDLKTLTDYFHNSLVTALKPQMEVVDQAGSNVVVMRIALTNLVPTNVARSATGTLIPYAFVAEAGSGVATGRPVGSTPYMGEAGMEMQLRDGESAMILAECRDTQIGRKYALDDDGSVTDAAQTWASGYLNSFQAWSYARNAFDKWSLIIAQRFAELRGVEPLPK